MNVFAHPSTLPILPDMLRLRGQEPDMVQRDLRRVHLHRLLCRAQKSRCSHYFRSVDQFRHQLVLDPTTEHAVGWQCKRIPVLPAAQLQHNGCSAEIQFQGGTALPGQVGKYRPASDEGAWNEGKKEGFVLVCHTFDE